MTEDGIFTVAKDEQQPKAPLSILTTDDGMIIDFIDLHPQNASTPMLVTEEGISMCANAEQYWKVLRSILVIEQGILIELRDEHLLKAKLPMLCTDFGISIANVDREEQFSNDLLPIDFTEYGISIDLREAQSLKASLSILLIAEVGTISTFFSLVQPWKVFSGIDAIDGCIITVVTLFGILP